MSRIIKVRPTKIELVRLKRRLSLATRVQKIVKDRLSILTMEFLQVARECVKMREKLFSELSENYKVLSIAEGYHGDLVLDRELMTAMVEVNIVGGTQNVAGVRLPRFEVEKSTSGGRGYNMIDTSSLIDRTAEMSQKSMETLVELAELQRSLELLGMEIAKAKRITNALEYILIPSLLETINYLNMKFEEREREEKARLKRVKLLIESR